MALEIQFPSGALLFYKPRINQLTSSPVTPSQNIEFSTGVIKKMLLQVHVHVFTHLYCRIKLNRYIAKICNINSSAVGHYQKMESPIFIMIRPCAFCL